MPILFVSYFLNVNGSLRKEKVGLRAMEGLFQRPWWSWNDKGLRQQLNFELFHSEIYFCPFFSWSDLLESSKTYTNVG